MIPSPSRYVISDVHLDPAHPERDTALCAFLAHVTPHVHSLWILGDLFDAWVGDDDPVPYHMPGVLALIQTAARRPVYVLKGNRDCLLGPVFAQRTGMQLLPDCSAHLWNRQRVLLLHGDTLCTQDTAYMAFRAHVRTPEVQQAFLRLPLDQRKQQAQAMRARSVSQQGQAITDVHPPAVAALIQQQPCDVIIHGHTHLSRCHVHHQTTRFVLGDWGTQGAWVLQWPLDASQPHLHRFSHPSTL